MKRRMCRDPDKANPRSRRHARTYSRTRPHSLASLSLPAYTRSRSWGAVQSSANRSDPQEGRWSCCRSSDRSSALNNHKKLAPDPGFRMPACSRSESMAAHTLRSTARNCTWGIHWTRWDPHTPRTARYPPGQPGTPALRAPARTRAAPGTTTQAAGEAHTDPDTSHSSGRADQGTFRRMNDRRSRYCIRTEGERPPGTRPRVSSWKVRGSRLTSDNRTSKAPSARPSRSAHRRSARTYQAGRMGPSPSCRRGCFLD